MAWVIPFKTISGDDLRVEISGGDGTLTGAAQPFVVEMDDDEDLFKAVRTQSGNITVVCKWEDIKDIVCSTPKQRQVTLLTGTGTDTKVLWRGYVRCETFEFEYTPFVQEFQIPIVSLLGLQEYVPMPKETGFVTFVDILKEISSWEYVYFPNALSGNMSNYVINRANYLQEREYEDADGNKYDSSTYLDVLEDICNYLGCSLMEANNCLYFMSNDNTTIYRKVSWQELIDIDYEDQFTTVTRNVLSLPAFVSDEQSVSTIPGKNAVNVEGEVNEPSESIYTFNPEKDLKYIGNVSYYDIENDPNRTYKSREFLSQIGEEVAGYQFVQGSSTPAEINNIKYTNSISNEYLYEGGCLCNECIYGDDYEKNFVSRIILKNAYNSPTILRIAPWRNIYHASYGYVQLKVSDVKCTYEHRGLFEDNFTGYICCYIRNARGLYWIPDKGWIEDKEPYYIHITDGKAAVACNEHTYYAENEGVLIDWWDGIDDYIPDKITIEIYKIEYESHELYEHYVSIGNLSLSIHYDNIETYATSDNNTYSKALDNGFEDGISVKCGLTNTNLGQVGFGLVSRQPFDKRPEIYLGERMVAYYAKSHTMYKFIVRGRDILDPINTYMVGNQECTIISQSIDPRYEELTLTLLSLE